MKDVPRRIVCLTEESVELIYALGEEKRIVGVTNYVQFPIEAKNLPKISVFTKANSKKIAELEPDLILGFSDIQKDVARDLIGDGFNVLIANFRSIQDILDYYLLLGKIVGQELKARELVEQIQKLIEKASKNLSSRRPKVYFEEWDGPYISGIRWVSEMIEICGGENIAKELAKKPMAKDRILTDEQIIKESPDIILACWCGKKVDLKSIKKRPGWERINAIANNRLYECDPAIFLGGGPSLFLKGIPVLLDHFKFF